MEDRSGQVLAVNILFFVLSWLTVSLRVYVRAGMLKSFGIDDWLMVVSHLIFTAYLICQLGGVIHGTGRHVWDVKLENYVKALRFWFFCEVFYVASCCLLKVSIGVFLLRIAVQRLHIWIIWLFIAGNIIFGTVYDLLVLFQCNPISAWWTLERKGCLDPKIIVDATYAASAINAVADWTFGTLPIFMVKNLNMSKRTKGIVIGILSFAAIGSTATCVRIQYVAALGDVKDFLWSTTDIAIWSTVEVGVGITAGCAATLRPLLKLVLAKAGISSSGHGSGMPWSQSNLQRAGYQRSIGLDDLRRDGMPGGATTTTTIVGGGSSKQASRTLRGQGSDEELIGISKNVMVTYTMETELEPRRDRESITRMSD
ncbi:putative integral membrane protein [Thermoascus aurantiacus ATCC 26904]